MLQVVKKKNINIWLQEVQVVQELMVATLKV